MYKKIIAFVSLATLSMATPAAAGLVADGAYADFLTIPSSTSTHFSLVDESVCNGLTDGVRVKNARSNNGSKDSYIIDSSVIPYGAEITYVGVTPCASRNSSKTNGSSVANFFFKNGSAETTVGSYSLPAGNVPVPLASSTVATSSLGFYFGSSTPLEIGVEYFSGNRGVRLSQLSGYLGYQYLNGSSTSFGFLSF